MRSTKIRLSESAQPGGFQNGGSSPSRAKANGTGSRSYESRPADGDSSDSVPMHPLGLKPLGNRYMITGPTARESLGSLQSLPDETILVLLEYLDEFALRKLGYTCRFLYACCRSDDLWKQLFVG